MIVKILIALVIIAILAGVAWLAFLARKESNNSINQPQADLAKFKKFTLIKEEDEVYYKLGDSEYQRVNDAKIELENHSFVKTTIGRAQMVLPNQSLISIDRGSEMQINFDDQKTSILQTIGNSWHRVEGLVGVEQYEVETPTAVATIRGTKFAVKVQEGSKSTKIASILVTDGKVNVGQIKVEEGKKVIEQAIEVEKGSKVEVAPIEFKRELKTVEIPPEEKNNEWFKRNEVIDKNFDEEIKKIYEGGGPGDIKKQFEQKIIENFEQKKILEQIKQELPPELIRAEEKRRELLKEEMFRENIKEKTNDSVRQSPAGSTLQQNQDSPIQRNNETRRDEPKGDEPQKINQQEGSPQVQGSSIQQIPLMQIVPLLQTQKIEEKKIERIESLIEQREEPKVSQPKTETAEDKQEGGEEKREQVLPKVDLILGKDDKKDAKDDRADGEKNKRR